MKHKTSKLLYDYWDQIRAGRKAPKRFEVEPANIGTILPETFILEYDDAQTINFRLAGTRICEQFGREFRGVNILELWSDSDRITLERHVALIRTDAAIGVSTFTASTSQGNTAQFELLLLPLYHTRPIISRFLGAISVIDTPSWLGHEQLRTLSLTGNKVIWPDGAPSQPHKEVFARTKPTLVDNNHGRIVRYDRRQFRVFEGGLAKSPPERN